MAAELLPPLETLDAPMGGSIGYRALGSGGWLVLVHGWCGTADIWNPIVPALVRDYRILAVTLPGFGGMAPPPEAGRTIRAMARPSPACSPISASTAPCSSAIRWAGRS